MLTRAAQTAFNRANRAFAYYSGLFIGKPFSRNQDDRFALFRDKVCEPLKHVLKLNVFFLGGAQVSELGSTSSIGALG